MGDSFKTRLVTYIGSVLLNGAREVVTIELWPKSPVYDFLIRLSGKQAF